MVALAYLPGSLTMPAYTKKDQMIEDLLRRIADGEFPPGSKLPSGTELIEQYVVSRQVVRSVIDHLKSTGVVVGVPGSGVYVRKS